MLTHYRIELMSRDGRISQEVLIKKTMRMGKESYGVTMVKSILESFSTIKKP